ncbi:MAG TPA: glycosyltransferase family 2 protein [Deltaproteobacteria bacterium]|nr:glycosyltransferase family 2 protein [Deltaproteobacteria bacterium]
MTALFWGALGAIAYTYFGYPLILLVCSWFMKRTVRKDHRYTPPVTLIITVHNEAARIEKKILNTLDLDYPSELFEIIFASDASIDGTDEAVLLHAGPKLRLVRSPRRGGKEYAQKCALEQAAGEIIVFSDVATMLERQAIRRIVSSFADPSVGCVSSEDRFIDEKGNVSGEGAYVRYEMWLRSLESKVHSLVGLSGSFFAARRNLCRDWPTDIPSDFNTLLNAVRNGYRGITDPESIGMYQNIRDEGKEFQRKVRTITRGISALLSDISLMNPLRYGIFSWQLVSHKLLRWLVPLFMAIAFIANMVLGFSKRVYLVVFICHVLFYVMPSLSYTMGLRSSLIKIPYFFVLVNRAIAVAWLNYIKGQRYVIWTPTER